MGQLEPLTVLALVRPSPLGQLSEALPVSFHLRSDRTG